MSQPTQLIRPHMLDQPGLAQLPNRVQFQNGLKQLWDQYETAPPGSQVKQQIEDKIRQVSSKLSTMIAGHLRGGGQQARPGSGGGQQGQQGQQQGQQQRPGQPSSSAAPAGPAANPTQTPAQAQARLQAAQSTTQPGQSGGQRATPTLSARIQQELDNLVARPPAHIAPQDHDRWRASYYQTCARMLQQREQTANTYRQRNSQVASMLQNNQDPPEPLKASVNETRQSLNQMVAQWSKMVASGGGLKEQRPTTQQGMAAPPEMKAAPSGEGQRNSTSPTTQQPPTGFPQQHPTQQPPPNASASVMGQPGLSQQQPAASQAQSAQQQQHQRAQHVNAQPPRPGQNFQQNNMPPQPQPQQQQQQQQQRPQINTQHLSSSSMPQSSQHPASAMPPSANQNQGPPQALSHQAAMSQAAEQYSRQQQAQLPAQQMPQQMPNGLPYPNQPGSAAPQGTPTSAYPSLQSTGQQMSTGNHKFKIPTQLNVDARINQQAQAPPSRPTLANQGMMFSPAIPRPPPYTLEGEGNRVLSKRKLDELVRQVTGAAPSSENGETAAVLSPDVEESIMQVADNFVDDVVGMACRLAKLRPNSTLDIKDVQIALERGYNIRIPGYSLDEVRTVRKFQPAPGWQTKMQAVQAGKVMGHREG